VKSAILFMLTIILINVALAVYAFTRGDFLAGVASTCAVILFVLALMKARDGR
jgi:uncharacterized membrane protein